MMDVDGTIETNHSNILNKLDTVGRLIDLLLTYDFQTNINLIAHKKFMVIVDTYEHIKYNYETEVIDVLTKYYDNTVCKKNNQANNHISDLYNMYITGNDYVGKLRQCVDFIKSVSSFISAGGEDDDMVVSLNTIIDQYDKAVVSTTVKHVDYDICVCGSKMNIISNKSELVCLNCGETIHMYGTVFEDTYFYNGDGNRTRRGCHESSRHCKFWVQCIQANEKTDIHRKCIERLVQCIRRDGNVDGRRLLCSQIRVYLKEIGFTGYNDHVPLIRKIITGVAPPQLKNQELKILRNIFDKAVDEYEKVKPPSKTNTIYYPYIIYKILDIILPNGIRKRRILECIHLQSRDTLISNDELWLKICNRVSVLSGKYKPTDRNDNVLEL